MRQWKPSLMVVTALALAPVAYSQTCNPNIPATAPDSRYVDHGDGTVTDNSTGLMWKQCPEGLSGAGCGSGAMQYLSWQAALQQGEGLTFAGHSDWRLPNVKELTSLVERRCYYPAINAILFPTTPSGWFWSSSPDAYGSNVAWVVDFDYGGVLLYPPGVDYYGRGNGSLAVRLVRGGQ